MTRGKLRTGIALLAAVLALPAVAFAGEAGSEAEPQAQAPAMEPQPEASAPTADRIASPHVIVVEGSLDRVPAPAAGMVVAIDPVTGERRAPTAAETADLSAAARYGEKHPAGADLYQFSTAGGGTGLLLDGRYVISETVTRKLDGSLSAGHRAGNGDSIEALLQAAAEATSEPAAGQDAAGQAATDEEVQP